MSITNDPAPTWWTDQWNAAADATAHTTTVPGAATWHARDILRQRLTAETGTAPLLPGFTTDDLRWTEFADALDARDVRRAQAITSDAEQDHPDRHTFYQHPFCPSCAGMEIAWLRLQRWVTLNPGKTPRDTWDGVTYPEDTEAGASAFLTWDDLDNLPEPEWLIDGIVPQGSVGYITGRDGTFKTFLALDFALSIVTVRPDWLGRHIEWNGYGRALYLAGEGVRSFKHRIAAWQANRGVTVDPHMKAGLIVRNGTVDLYSGREEFQALLAVIADQQPDLIVVDTLARSVGGADQNSAGDMGVVRQRIEQMKRAGSPDATIIVIAHTDKGDNDARGSSTIEDDADFVLHCKRTADADELRVVIHKMKDGPDHWDLDLAVNTVDLGDGVSSLALGLPGQGGAKPKYLGDDLRFRLTSLLYRVRSSDAPSGTQIVALLKEDGTGRDVSRALVYEVLGTLEREGIVTSEKIGTAKRYTLNAHHYPAGEAADHDPLA